MVEQAAKAEIDAVLQDVGRIKAEFPLTLKQLCMQFGYHFIPLTALFEALGYTGVTGLQWGALIGIAATLIEGTEYQIVKFGRQRFLKKR